MIVIKLVLLIVWLLGIPLCIGGIPAAFVDKQNKSLAFMCISGYMMMWAAFQLICVPFVLLEKWFHGMFPYVVYGFGAVSGVLAVVGLVLVCRKNRGQAAFGADWKVSSVKSKICWGVFVILLAVQLGASVLGTYGDGDDAFYVAVSTITEASNTLYKIMPYNVGATGLDLRHGLAPFPIWIAFLARVSGLKSVFVAHVAVGTFLIAMTYMIFYKIGDMLFENDQEKLPLFLI